jgi:hypothetical protein
LNVSEAQLDKMETTLEQINKPFYRLRYPSDKPHQVYGRPAWQRFGTASWSDKVGGLSTGRLLWPYGEPRVSLSIVLPSHRLGDFVWTYDSDCIVTERVLSLFRQIGFTGFVALPVTIEKVKGMRRKGAEELTVPPLWELAIQGKGGDAAPESGIRVLSEWENYSGVMQPLYSSFRNGIIVDEANWDGSDFFTVNGYPKYILVTERVKEFIIVHQLTNCALIPSHRLEWGSDIRPEDSLAKTRAMASRDLDSLLADLEKSDLSRDVIRALAYKGDPRALEPLFTILDDPDPFIWRPAASAVAEISKKKETPEVIRKEIFSKLCDLLSHDNPIMRKNAARGLSFIGGEEAAEEIARLLDDPDPLVRDSAVFIMGFLHYRPALEVVRRLTKDRSKAVRETARLVVSRLSSEFR